MAFDNVAGILRIESPFSSFKLLLLTGAFSRPNLRARCVSLLRPFTKNGEVLLRYRCHDRYLQSFVRISDLESDVLSVLELGVRIHTILISGLSLIW